MIRIVIDPDKCVGSGNCVFWAPNTFDLDDDAKAVVIDPAGDPEDRIRVAAEGCPAAAIYVEPLEASGAEAQD
jgi:ferredoxin